MNRLATLLPALLDGGAIGVLTKVSVLLAVAALLALAAWRASAAVRHVIWTIALGACLAVAVFTPAAPRLVVRLRQSSAAPSRPIYSTISHAVSRAAPRAVIARSRALVDDYAPSVRYVAKRAVRSVGVWRRASASTIVAIIWLAGALVVLTRLAFGHLAVRRLIACADEAGVFRDAELRQIARELGIRRPVRLRMSPTLGGPMTCGALRPTILLPADAAHWSAERRRAVLLHELAHVARYDYGAQVLATIVCALFWFHPGVWLAAARLRSESELAADDCVLAAGMSGISYATHLLDVARASHATRFAAAASIGMARPTHLEGRFRAMLDSTRPRAAVALRTQLAVAVVAVVALVPLAGLRGELTAAPLARKFARRGVSPSQVLNVAPAKTPAVQRFVDSTFERSASAEPGGRLVLDLPTGGEVVIQGWSESQVRVRASLGGRDWSRTNVTLGKTGNSVVLRSAIDRDGSTSTSHRFEVWVPRHFDIQISSAGGGVSIRDVAGNFRGSTGGGAIEIEGASGSVGLTTGGGDVVVTQSELVGSVRSGSGAFWTSSPEYRGFRGVTQGGGTTAAIAGTAPASISGGVAGTSGQAVATTAAQTGSITGGIAGGVGPATIAGQRGTTVSSGYGVGYGVGGARTTYGTITTTNEQGVTRTYNRSGDLTSTTVSQGYGPRTVNISKAGGNISVGTAADGGVLFTGGGAITVDEAGGFLSATTGGGVVMLYRVSGNANVNTGAGDVVIRVVNEETRVHTITVRSGHGQVEIELPSDLDARLDIETAYTEMAPRPTRIESDFALNRTETSTLDAGEGTPRRYVRGTATVGSGRGVIQIRTVNGDVVIRRTP